MIFYNFALLLVLLVGSPYWLLRMATSGKYRAGLASRFGRVPRALQLAIAGREVLWLHAVSVGEVISASRVVADLRTALPEFVVVISTTTRAGQILARQRFGAETVFYFPLDFSFVVRRYLRALRPRLLILAETEFWPSLLSECSRHQVPVAVINARISDRSFPRYRRLRWLWQRLLADVTIFLAQSDEDARRLKAIGAPVDRVQVSGNLKFDVRPAADNTFTNALRAALPPQSAVLVAGSTLEGEEAALLQAWPRILREAPNAIMLLAPRHPERFKAVAALLDTSGIPWHRRTQWLAADMDTDTAANSGTAPLQPGSILLLDSIGELAACYSLATVAYVGGSLVKGGGHNPLEPAQFGVPVVMGPSLENFRAIAHDMLRSEALLLVDTTILAPTLSRLLTHPEGAAAIGARARVVFGSQAGATDRTIAALLKILQSADAAPRKTSATQRPALLPLTPLYAAGIAAKNRWYDSGRLTQEKLSWPVISIGSLSAGGAGKTPFTLLLASALREHGWHIDVLTRGYRRKGKQPEYVDPAGSAIHFGDEPLLMSRYGLDVFVANVRLEAGKLAEATLPPKPHRVHLLDDGFQHRRLQRSLDIVLFTEQDWTDTLLPMGNLREHVTSLLRADAIVLRDEEAWLQSQLHKFFEYDNFHPEFILIRRTLSLENAPSRPLVFCGIARPNVFHDMLRRAGHNPSRAVGLFSDHQNYTPSIIDGLVKGARMSNCDGFITTEKDAVKLTPDLRRTLESVGPIAVAKLQTSFCDQASVMHWLLTRLPAGGK